MLPSAAPVRDVSDVQTHLPAQFVVIEIPGYCTANLAGIAFAFKHLLNDAH